ncbi:MAG: hypothetical protein KIG91_01640 [Treponema sp.]|nr:hypothetical protein [Treponema sp.]
MKPPVVVYSYFFTVSPPSPPFPPAGSFPGYSGVAGASEFVPESGFPSSGFVVSSVDGLQLIRSKKKRQSPEKLPPIYFNQDGALLRHPGKKKDFGNPKSF